MEIRINSIHFDASERLQDFIQQKVSKLKQYDENISSAEIFLKLDKAESTENKISEIKLSIPRSEFFAKKQAKTFEEATDLTVEALRRQLLKHKDKIRSK